MNLKKLKTNAQYQRKMISKNPHLIEKVDKLFKTTPFPIELINENNIHKIPFSTICNHIRFNEYKILNIVHLLNTSQLNELVKINSNCFGYIPAYKRKPSTWRIFLSNTSNKLPPVVDINEEPYEIKILLLQKFPEMIKNLRKQKIRYCWIAVRNQLEVLEYIRNPPLKICEYVYESMRQNGLIIARCFPPRIFKFLENKYQIKNF